MSPRNGFGYSDEARRMADNINIHYQSIGWEAVGKWAAIRLADGTSDCTLYDTRRDAVRHQTHEQLCLYVKIVPMAMSPKEAQTLLDFHRKAYDAGFRLVDPDHKTGGRELIVRSRARETVAAMLQSFGTRR